MNNNRPLSQLTAFAPALMAALAFTFALGSSPAARAQLVADGATYTLNGTSQDLGSATLTIGDTGPNTTLNIINGGTLENGFCNIGVNVGSINNRVLVNGLNSAWRNNGRLALGFASSFNTLTITNRAAVTNSSALIGANASASNNKAIVTGVNATLMNTGELSVGASGSENSMLIQNGGRVINQIGLGAIGLNGSSERNEVIVSGLNSVWMSNGDRLSVGEAGSFNMLLITNGGTVRNSAGAIGRQTSANGNQALVRGAGSLWHNTSDLRIGESGAFNSLLITNSAMVSNIVGYISYNSQASTNQVTVTGPGSMWNNPFGIYVGYRGTHATLLINNGGTVKTDSSGYVGIFSTADNNEAIVSGSGSAWNNGGDTVVGRDGHFNTLHITDGGIVRNGGGSIGTSPGANNNRVTVSGTNSTWHHDFRTLHVGESGSFNTLLISNGGTVTNNFDGNIGRNSGANGNLVIVTDPNSAWKNINDLFVGAGGSFNSLLINNGAAVTNRNGFIGGGPGSDNNQATVTGPNAAWNNGGFLFINGSFNTLLITNGGTVWIKSAAFIGNSEGESNQAIVTGLTSKWLIGGDLAVGRMGSFNSLRITDGATVTNFTSTIGNFEGANTNQVIVSGPTAQWISRDVRVGDSGAHNSLLITNGATVTVLRSVGIGSSPTSTNNRVTVSDGTLRASNGAGGGSISISHGSLVLNAGDVETDQFLMGNPSGTIEFNGGTLRVGFAPVDNGAVFTVGNGVSVATLSLANNGFMTFADGLTIAPNAILTGSGTVHGPVTVTGNLNISPGSSGENFTLDTPPILQGRVTMEINKSGTFISQDQLRVTGPITYGGLLAVSNLGTGPFALGDTFKLFNATSYSGAFSARFLPALPEGLKWRNQLALDGTIVVASQFEPDFVDVTRSGTNMIFSVTDGVPGGAWNLLTSTNVAAPLSTWTTNRSGVFDPMGKVTLTNGINFGESKRFFMIQTP